MKKVIISRSKRVIKSHSEKTRKATERSSQMVSISFAKNGKALGGLNTGM
jgi:hypothetical protein